MIGTSLGFEEYYTGHLDEQRGKQNEKKGDEELYETWLSQLYDDAQRFSVLWSSRFECNLESLDEIR